MFITPTRHMFAALLLAAAVQPGNAASAQQPVPEPPPISSVWRGEAQSAVRYDEGRLDYITHLRLTTEAGAGLTAALTLPGYINVLSVNGDDLQQWHIVRAEDSTRRLDITWKTPDTLRRELVLNYERPQLLPAGDWQLTSPGLPESRGRLEAALYALPSMEGLEFATAGDAGAPLPLGNARQLPQWLVREMGGNNFVVLSVTNAALGSNETAVVRARQLPLVQTAKATVEESAFETRLVPDGAMLNKATWLIRHDGPLAFALTLPPRAQLLTCLTNTKETTPIDRGGGHIEIPLAMNPTEKPTSVTLSYTDKLAAFAPVSGQVALTLPQTPLFVKILRWDLQIPDAYELMGLEGNVTQVPAGSGRSDNSAAGIHLSKELLNGDQPSVELFYQKRSVNP